MRVFIVLFLTIAFLIAIGCGRAAAPVSVSSKPVTINNVPQTNAPLPPSKPIEEMYWAKIDGQTEKLKDLEGKVVVLDFWATYCPPCMQSIPHFVELQKKHRDLQVVGLNVGGDEDKPKIARTIQQFKINYTIATPEDALTSFIFSGEDTIPQTAIFDKKGRLVNKFIGYDQAIKADIDQTIAKALAQ